MKITGMFGGQQAVTILCSIVRIKLVALWIGPAGVGLFGIFNSAINSIASLSQLNIRQTAVRDITAATQQNVWAVALSTRRIALWLGLAGTILMLILSPLLADISFGDRSMWTAFACLSISIALITLNNGESAIFQGLKQFRRLTICATVGVIGGLAISIPLFYFWRLESIIPSIIAYYLVTWLMLGYNRQKIDTSEHKIGAKETFAIGRHFLKLGLYMTLSDLAVNAINYIFLAYLNHKSDLGAAGIYNAGFTIVSQYAGLIFTAIAMEYFPRLASVANQPRRESAFVGNQAIFALSILVPIATTFVICVAPVVRLLYSNDFMPVIPMVALAMTGTAFRAVSWCMAFVIVARGDGPVFLLTETLSAAVALSLNILGYNLGGYTGLGIAYTVWYAIYTVIVATVYFKRYHLRLNRSVWQALAYAVVLTAAASAVSLWISPLWAIPVALFAWARTWLMLRRH